MHIFHNLDEWINFRNTLSTELSLGFAPTMGNLHAGHASLFTKSKDENDRTVSSLFINPTQFNNPDDFTHYPRTLDADLELMAQSGVDYCILPTDKEMYPDGYAYQVQEHQLCQLMEGKHRPGHFNGVLTVVMKLLNITRPNRAYFGEKDYQQYLLIQGMVKALFMNVEVIPCPTIRESSGLAYSSRNNRLTIEQKKRAEEFANIFHQNKPCVMISEELQAKGIAVEYIEEYLGRKFAAVMIGEIRLIDNYQI
ncbi:pantoate--beta-alanine ligase [Legionella quateirensis]|uniref:Pantothenate synthetase n=1 Tax=Legionella quateirensis TaxID=45072 RepID=A0A378KX42_9GAMM|nr:pantoate--beta-alanine ligase [Legionella quateirensis]KTD52734.1 pantoate-beta-alanine ligase [Legionella quateirensis]STY19152.1 pantoate--beta-alanine ligase [Legionella quateirensis]